MFSSVMTFYFVLYCRLTESDPHQLYHRLQAQVHEVATAVKVRLKDISEDQHQDSLVATDFFEGNYVLL